jgi:hypothetical protein
MADARRKELITQLRFTALKPKLISIAGKAIFTEDTKKVLRNEAIVDMQSK